MIFPFSGLESVPCLLAAICSLRDAGAIVDVFTRSCDGALELGADRCHAPQGRGGFMEDPLEKPAWARLVPYAWFDGLVASSLRRKKKRSTLDGLVRGLHQEHPFSILIGVDPEGLIEAEAWGRELGVPYAYWSLEILVAGELTSPHFNRLKRREVRANRGAAFTIVQDADRGRLLGSENDIESRNMLLVPNAAAGPARRIKSHFAHGLLDIPDDSRLVLCAGTLADWCMTEEIVRAAATWPDGTVLIVHSRFDAEADPYVAHIVAVADSERVRLSRTTLDASDYRALVDSADVGLALYRPRRNQRYLQANLLTVGLSSGKVSAYLQAGLPVIVNRLRGLADLVDSYGCGLIVDAPEDIGTALDAISTRYDQYSRAALKCFSDELRFEPHFAAVLRRLSLDAPTCDTVLS